MEISQNSFHIQVFKIAFLKKSFDLFQYWQVLVFEVKKHLLSHLALFKYLVNDFERYLTISCL